jgi:hypothetical protein
MALEAEVVEYSVRPRAAVDIDGDDPRVDALLDALIEDERALGAWGVSSAGGELACTFQVELFSAWTWGRRPGVSEAAVLAERIFNEALGRAGIPARVTAVAAVAGSDPELLP